MEVARRLDPNTSQDSPPSSSAKVSPEAVKSCWSRKRPPTPFSREKSPLTGCLNTKVYQQAQKLPVQSSLEGSIGNSDSASHNQTQQETESSGPPTCTNLLASLPTHIPASSTLPTISVTSPTTSTPNNSPPARPTALPSGPPIRSPLPLEWQYSEPSEESNNRSNLLILSASSSPLQSPSGSNPPIVLNPSFSAEPSTSRRSLLPKFTKFGRKRSKSPLLGIAALNAKPNPPSQISLDWDNYTSSPTYFQRIIPVISTPSTSLESSPERIGTPTSVIMSVRRCTKCHLYISGAPSPDLEHVGKYGPDCDSAHHPEPCEYVHRDTGACTQYNDIVRPPASDEQAKFVQQASPELAVGDGSSENMIQDNKDLLLEMNKVDTKMRMFPVQLMTMDRLGSYEQVLTGLMDQFLEFSTKVVTFAINYAGTPNPPLNGDGQPMNVEFWQAKEQELGQRMTNHQIEIRRAATELQLRRSMTEFERKEIDMKEKELKLKERQIELMEENQIKADKEKKTKANAVANSKYEEIMLVSTELDDCLDKITDWGKATRSEVMTAMKSIETWGQKFSTLNKAHREFTMATSTYMLPDESTRVEEVIEETTKKFKEVTEAIELEDKKRELYSLAGSNKEQVKLPRFGGSSGEDFSTFKSKLLLAMEKNMIPASDKIEKLRSCLSGAALALVPEKSHDFLKALEVLGDAFGNPERVLQVRLGDIKKLGKCPPEVVNGKRNFSAIVSFCLKAEVLIQDLLDLAEQDECEQLKYDVYSSAVRSSIQKLFGLKEEKKMRAIATRGRAGLEDHLKFIKDIRSKSQMMVDTSGTDRSNKRDDENTEKEPRKSTSHNMFKQPRKVSDCRVCKVLNEDGVDGVFDDHISEEITGCPKFQAMIAEERRAICMRAKLCMKCCDPKVLFDARHRRECKVSRKNKFNITCSEHPDCLMHSWLCGYHQDTNLVKLREFSKKFKVQPPVNTNTATVPANVVVDTTKILKNMKRNLKKRGAELIPIPEGDSMFVLAPLKGKSEPVLGFFDSGCSDAVAKHGIPGTQLNGICINEGPINCFGVGATQIKAKQEWLIKLKKKDGNYQLVQTLTMDTVCAPMPLVNTSQAVHELKESDKVNSVLQNCRVPPQVGGNVDLILGIRYNNIGPKAIHTLESGLTIYSINLETHDSSINAAIGGPHSSFSAMVNYSGGITRVKHTLQNLYVAIDNFKKYGAPSIPVLPINAKELEYRKHYIQEEYGICGLVNVSDEFESESEDEGAVETSRDDMRLLEDSGDNQGPPEITRGHTCCTSMSEDEGNLRDLKYWYKQMEAGTSVEYRCPACRECVKCKNSDTTDKVSLREEVEQKAVEDSVFFDREKKKVMVKLPKRGKEEFFLSSNRDIALKVYKKICEKATKSEETKKEINAAFNKLFKNGHAVCLGDIENKRVEKFIKKSVQHYLPYRLVWKADSTTTPCRPVFDASTNTRKRNDGSGGGRSLNDLLCKGRVDTLNLIKMMIRFTIGAFAITGDLQQFYCCCKLFDEELNLTRFLYHPDLDPNSEPLECVILALIYGLKSASAQTEFMKCKLADEIRDTLPELALLLDESTYVDDMGESKVDKENIDSLASDADRILGDLGVTVKAWSKTGEKPSEVVSDDGVSVLVGGLQWFPEIDSVSVRIPSLHFGKRRRGKLDKNTEFFFATGGEDDLTRIGKFCPVLTRRVCASKAASIFDLMGLLAPVLAGIKILMSETVKATEDWDEEIPDNLRNKWLLAFLRIESLRGIQFTRPVMPANAVNKHIRLIGLSDAAKPIIIVGVWGGFELPNARFSCRLIMGRSILSSDTTIPKLELEGTCAVANLGWMVRSALKGWSVSYLQGSDSTIALSWITSEHLRLSEFHRNRVVQVRRAVEIENLYHVTTDVNVADCGTRPDKVAVEDVMEGSRWHDGEEWMTWPVEKAIQQGCLTPAKELRISDSEKEDYKEGIIFEKVPELLTRGHVLNKERISKIEERARYSNYFISPIKYGFKMSFRITLLVIKFLVRCRRGKPFTGPKLSSPLRRVPTILSPHHRFKQNQGAQQNDEKAVDPIFYLSPEIRRKMKEMLDEEMMMEEELSGWLTITYLLRTATEEVRQFVKEETLGKISIESEGVLYSKSRILESMEFKTVSGMDMVDLEPLGINVRTPIIERYSPLAYAIAQYIHYDVSGHAGLETCNRLSLERVFIIQGVSLYREISAECITCKIKRKRFLEMSMGPIGQHNLTIAPPFYACQADLFGPVMVYAPGAHKDLRGRPANACKVWSIVFTCPVTRLINCQVIEKSDHSGIVDGVLRLAAEVGFPKYFMVDQDGPLMKALKEVSVNMRDLQHRLFTEHGVVFTTCPVGGHNMHGHVERVIQSVQHLLEDCGVKQKRLHATGYQTLLKLVENLYNSLPLGYSYDKSVTNTPLLRIITPNFFKMGRNNDRALDGPVHVPNGTQMIQKISETYRGLFKLWADVYVPKLVFSPKWYKDDEDLKVGDLVYLKKSPDNKLDSTWVIGIVEQLLPSRDGKVRRVVVKYTNSSGSPEYDAEPQFTDRAVRQLVKIFDIDEFVLQDDLSDLIKRLDTDRKKEEEERTEDPHQDSHTIGVNLQTNILVKNIQDKMPILDSSVSAVLMKYFDMAACNNTTFS